MLRDLVHPAYNARDVLSIERRSSPDDENETQIGQHGDFIEYPFKNLPGIYEGFSDDVPLAHEDFMLFPQQIEQPVPSGNRGTNTSTSTHPPQLRFSGIDNEHERLRISSSNCPITTIFEGFKQHILHLNPMLAEKHEYPLNRIAHLQVGRYNQLLTCRTQHEELIAVGECPSGSKCKSVGGLFPPLPSVAGGDIIDIGPNSFPVPMPRPHTTSPPAEFECDLCFQVVRITAPADWTRHVCEDLQPFCCTRIECEHPTTFKSTSDWISHENMMHRKIDPERWICNLSFCRLSLGRRDQFLDHLVEDHNYPNANTTPDAAASHVEDIRWKKVEECYQKGVKRSQDEPCCFCGKISPTWENVLDHLAGHMKQISLPIVTLITRRDPGDGLQFPITSLVQVKPLLTILVQLLLRSKTFSLEIMNFVSRHMCLTSQTAPRLDSGRKRGSQ